MIYKSRLAFKRDGRAGFSLFELTVVIAILSIIAGITVSSIGKWIALSKIDAVKTLLNSAAAECLEGVRQEQDPADLKPSDTTISSENLECYNYKIKSNDTSGLENTCASYFVEPINEEEKFMYKLGFKISINGDIVKIAVPADDKGSLNSCKNWAGVNCGVSAEQQSIWDALAKIEKDKKTCNEDFYKWLQGPPPASGMKVRWDETTKTCSLETWAYKGTIQKDEESVKKARDADVGAECAAKFKALANQSPPYDGPFVDDKCGTTYFCSGKDLATADATVYNSCKEEERKRRCDSALYLWKAQGANGKFIATDSKGEINGCESWWKCGSLLTQSQSEFDQSSCACIWRTETYIDGYTTENRITGYEQIRHPICGCLSGESKCKNGPYRTCNGNPIYTPVQVPIYKTREVCIR